MSKPTFVDDYAAITETLNKYNQGVAKADSAIMKPAFAKEATIFSAKDGALDGGAISGLSKASIPLSRRPRKAATRSLTST